MSKIISENLSEEFLYSLSSYYALQVSQASFACSSLRHSIYQIPMVVHLNIVFPAGLGGSRVNLILHFFAVVALLFFISRLEETNVFETYVISL